MRYFRSNYEHSHRIQQRLQVGLATAEERRVRSGRPLSRRVASVGMKRLTFQIIDDDTHFAVDLDAKSFTPKEIEVCIFTLVG